MHSTAYTVCLTVAAVFLVAGFFIFAWRAIVGPDSMDRMLANDGITASLQCALALSLIHI